MAFPWNAGPVFLKPSDTFLGTLPQGSFVVDRVSNYLEQSTCNGKEFLPSLNHTLTSKIMAGATSLAPIEYLFTKEITDVLIEPDS